MKKVSTYLDEIIDKGAAKNDSEIAAKLGITRASVSGWRSGKTAPNDEQAIALARLLGKPEIELMAEAAAHRAKTPESRSYWEKIAKYSATFASAAAIMILSSLCVTHLPESGASAQNNPERVFIM